MSESKHTPGPWIVDGSYTPNLVVGVGRDDDRLLACPGSGGAMSWTDKVCTMSWSGGEHDANARLIAAAPEMLDGLKFAAAQFWAYERIHRVKGTPNGDDKAEVNKKCAERLEAIIAKAEGRS